MATLPSGLGRFARGPLQGFCVLLYIVLVPALIDQRWRAVLGGTSGLIERSLLVTLALLWLGIIVTIVVTVTQLHRGHVLRRSGIVWLAGVLLAWITVALPSAASAAPAPAITGTHHVPQHVTSLVSLPFLLAAKRQRDQSLTPHDEATIDAVLVERESVDLTPLRRLHHFFAAAAAGVTTIPVDFGEWTDVDDEDPVGVCRVGDHNGETILGYARPGSTLPIPSPWSANQLIDELVGLPDNRLVFAGDERALLRALATRSHRTTVVYTGHPDDIDDELRALCVTLRRDDAHPITPPDRVSVSLLRAVPVVLGLTEPFAPTLRRRCVEMVAYLSVHPDPVSGDRLRSRVLVHADVDASKGTLSNTATAVRRSLGQDQDGNLLHPVTAAGLYQLHGVTCDVTEFHSLVGLARRQSASVAATTYQRALELVRGEPLASVTKGYDWFVLEGHRARLQRDGEWAALTLFEYARASGDVDRAFWALERGLLLDPDNQLLYETLEGAPRSRQFGGNLTRPPQNNAVGPRRAVAVSRPKLRLGHEVGE